MIKLPRVIGLTLCKRLDVDPTSGELSLVGIFQQLTFSAWPSPAYPFTAYALLYDGVGEGTIELVVNRLETEEDIYTYQRWFPLPGRGMPVHVEIPVRKCSFPAPGRYNLILRIDKDELTQRHLDIYSERSAS
jgi:hypothetical protein